MTTTRWEAKVYRGAVRLYPRSFREEYERDLVALLEDQLRDETAWRVAARTAVDLTLTVPARHLEAHMRGATNHTVPFLFGAIAISSLVVGLVVGHPLVLVACLAGAVVAGGIGLLAAHRERPLTNARPASARWWRLLVAGAGLLGALIAVTTATGELPEGTWLFAMITGLTALVLMAAGLVLGVAHLATRPSRHATT